MTTSVAGELLVASYYGYRSNASSGSWTPPAEMSEAADAHNGGSRSGSLDYGVAAAAGPTGAKTATASATLDYAIATLVALKPAGPTPITIDAELFGSADDVGALAAALALQQKGEAKLIAVGVDTRNTRAVTSASWRCAAAILQFYNAGDVPLGIDPPADGTSVADPDFATGCARLAAPSTPTPDPAVAVYRRALAGQPDGSVVMISTGYLENLSALLDSPPDSISPVSGRNLILKKVKRLVVMGGGYPSRARETNLAATPPRRRTSRRTGRRR